jgi:hypothetical protein
MLPAQNVFAAEDFDDVKKDRWSYEYIIRLRELGITEGTGGNKYEPSKNLTRAEFITFLSGLMKWDTDNINSVSYDDNHDTGQWYYKYIEAAVNNKTLLKESERFRPNDLITREDMAVFIVRALGYQELAGQLAYLPPPFPDVADSAGHINIAKDFGIISGITSYEFAPNNSATREQAATMLIRMYDALNNKIKYKNAFYAISSFSQADFINGFDSISFGWSRLETDGIEISLNTTAQNGNDYYTPEGYELPLSMAESKDRLLMVAVKESDSATIINNTNLSAEAVNAISTAISQGGLPFDGVVIDFETLKGEESKLNFNKFLFELRKTMPSKKIFVAVHPITPGEYYDAYDYKTIAGIADKVIIMAHDYNAKSLSEAEMAGNMNITPLSPINSVYYALRAAIDEIPDKQKIMLQLSFSSAQWQSTNDVITNENVLSPSYESIIKRIKSGANALFSEKYKSPYAIYSENGVDNIIWFENDKSISEKIKLAKLFGIENISVWRLGIIPDDNSVSGFNIYSTLKNS